MSQEQSPRCARSLCWCGVCHCEMCEFYRAAIILGRLLGVPLGICTPTIHDIDRLLANHTERQQQTYEEQAMAAAKRHLM